jgi:hypothetical protein
MATKEETKKSTSKVSNGAAVFQVVNVSDIHADYTWNARRVVTEEGDAATRTDEETNNTLRDLRDAIETDGQDTAIDVRTNTDPKIKKPYVLVTGFRRFAAVSAIYKDGRNIPGIPAGSIKANVHENMSEADAVALNVRENTARSQLGAPDTAWGIARILHFMPALSSVEMSKRIGKNQGYCNELMKIVKRCEDTGNAKILQAWREATPPLSVDAMKKAVLQCEPDRVADAYKEAVEGKGSGSGRGPTTGASAWLESSQKACVAFATKIGTLEKLGKISTDEGIFESMSIDDWKAIGVKTSGGKGEKSATKRQVEAWNRVAQEAFVNARGAEEAEEEETAKENGKRNSVEARARN